MSPRGAFFDSVADRVSDALIFGGVAWYMLNRPDPRLAILPVAILAASALVSYERAKAESLGYTARGGLMERAERLILLGVALFFHVVLVPLLVVLLALTLATATGRFFRVWRAASGKAPVPSPRLDRSRATVESKWRAWRESGRARPRRRQVEPLATRLRRVLPTHRDAISARPGSGRRRAADALRTRVHGR
jgi:CDP-diacylglycerol--glycerol-3-phosphate 3-phosphatidyltransferase